MYQMYMKIRLVQYPLDYIILENEHKKATESHGKQLSVFCVHPVIIIIIIICKYQ